MQLDIILQKHCVLYVIAYKMIVHKEIIFNYI